MNKPILTTLVIQILFTFSLALVTPLSAQAEKNRIKVMSFNVLHGGTRLGQSLSQSAKVIQEAKADVVGLQEIGKNTQKLAELLDWHYHSHGSSAILSRYEIVTRHHASVKIKLPSGLEAFIFNLHLKPAPYQPYQLLGIPYGGAPFIKTEAEAIASAKKARGSQVSALLKQIRSLPNEKIPIFVVGDFNEPSHLDWTEKAAKSGRHPIKVEFPHSLAMSNAGFRDAWRQAYPDEMKKPGFTWTPLTKENDPKDHHDRIDFVYFKGEGIKLKEAKIVGENKSKADIVVSPYPSDHRAIIATFTLAEPDQ